MEVEYYIYEIVNCDERYNYYCVYLNMDLSNRSLHQNSIIFSFVQI